MNSYQRPSSKLSKGAGGQEDDYDKIPLEALHFRNTALGLSSAETLSMSSKSSAGIIQTNKQHKPFELMTNIFDFIFNEINV